MPFLETFRSGKTVDKLYILEGCYTGPVRTIAREARKHDTIIQYVAKERGIRFRDRKTSGRDRRGGFL